MGRSFVVSGFGRSGTKWLAEMMDRSPTWHVEHEPNAAVAVDAIRDRFDVGRSVGNYGEVNSFALAAMQCLGVDREGVLLRCPRRLVVSSVRRGHALNEAFLAQLNVSLAMIDAAICRGVQAISFHRMVTDVAHAEQLLRDFGVEDVTLTEADLATPINASQGRLSWAKMGAGERSAVTETVDWFTRKYEALLDTVSA